MEYHTKVDSVVESIESDFERATTSKLIKKDGSGINKTAVAIQSHISKKRMKELGLQSIYGEEDTVIHEFFTEVLIRLSQKFSKGSVSEKMQKVLDATKAATVSEDDYHEVDMTDFYPVINLSAKTEKELYLMIERNSKRYTPASQYSPWSKTFRREELGPLIEAMPKGVMDYNPRKLNPVYKGDLTDIPEFSALDNPKVTVYNTWLPPRWRFNKIKEQVKPPKWIGMFFDYFYQKYPDCKMYMFEKMYQMVTDRSQVFLVLNGSTGIGKGLITDYIMRYGVGNTNHMVAPATWDKGTFNAYLKDKQIIVFDEARIAGKHRVEAMNTLKRISNDFMAIEQKGKDAEMMRLFTSFFITSNHGTTNFTLDLDNRRMSVLDITNIKMKREFMESDFNEIIKTITDFEYGEQELNQFWSYIMNTFEGKKPAYSVSDLWLGPTYWEFAFNSLHNWQQYLVEAILNCPDKEVTMEDLTADYTDYCASKGWRQDPWKVRETKVIEFLSQYKHLGDEKESLAQFGTMKNNEYGLIISDKYCSKLATQSSKYNLTTEL